MRIIISETARLGMQRLKMNEQDVLDFITGLDSAENAVCMDESGYYFCHRRLGTITIWMVYSRDGGQLVVEKIYHHRVMVLEDIG